MVTVIVSTGGVRAPGGAQADPPAGAVGVLSVPRSGDGRLPPCVCLCPPPAFTAGRGLFRGLGGGASAPPPEAPPRYLLGCVPPRAGRQQSRNSSGVGSASTSSRSPRKVRRGGALDTSNALGTGGLDPSGCVVQGQQAPLDFGASFRSAGRRSGVDQQPRAVNSEARPTRPECPVIRPSMPAAWPRR